MGRSAARLHDPLLPRVESVDRCSYLATTCRKFAREEASKVRDIKCSVVIDDTSCKGTEFFGSRDAGRSTCCLGFGDSLRARALRLLSFAIRSPLPKLDTHVARATRLFSITNRNRLSVGMVACDRKMSGFHRCILQGFARRHACFRSAADGSSEIIHHVGSARCD